MSGSPRFSTFTPPGARLCRTATIFEVRFFIIYYKNFFSRYCCVRYSSFSRYSAVISFMPDLRGVIGIGNFIAPCMGTLSFGPDYGFIVGGGSFFFFISGSVNLTSFLTAFLASSFLRRS
jgi:hypothetical protein